VGLGAELGRRRKDAVLAESGVDVLVGGGNNRQGRHAKSFREEGDCEMHGTLKAAPAPKITCGCHFIEVDA
jgi:hypothetical protein